MTEWIIWTLGVLTWAAVIALVLAFAFGIVIGAARGAIKGFRQQVELENRREIGRNLQAAAWWFSANHDTMRALQLLSTAMAKGSDPLQAVPEARDAWLRECANRKAQAHVSRLH